jgi:aspartate kinase
VSISVLKFGGTSVKNISRIHHVADVVAKCGSKKCVVVVSAMGDTTDHLYSLAKQCATVPNKRELDLLLATGEQVSIALLALTLQERESMQNPTRVLKLVSQLIIRTAQRESWTSAETP